MRSFGTSDSGTCTVASTTINAASGTASRSACSRTEWASRSVCPFHGSPACANASLLIGAVAIASTSPARAAFTARTMTSYAARPASADVVPTGTLTGGSGAKITGSHAASTRASAAAFPAISGPMPAGSPTVMATRGFISGSRASPPRPLDPRYVRSRRSRDRRRRTPRARAHRRTVWRARSARRPARGWPARARRRPR